MQAFPGGKPRTTEEPSPLPELLLRVVQSTQHVGTATEKLKRMNEQLAAARRALEANERAVVECKAATKQGAASHDASHDAYARLGKLM